MVGEHHPSLDLVLAQAGGLGAGCHVVAQLGQAGQVRRRRLLVIHGHHVHLLGEGDEICQPLGSAPMVPGAGGDGGLVCLRAQDDDVHGQCDGGLVGHAGELAASDDSDGVHGATFIGSTSE